MADGPESMQALMLDRRVAGIAFSRAIAIAVGFHSLTLAVEIALSGQGLAKGVGTIVTFGIISAVWATAFPRGAAFVLLVLFALGLISVIVGSLVVYKNEGIVVMVPFAVVAIPSEIFAVASAWCARPLARSYRQARRRFGTARRDDRLQAGCGM